MITWLSASHSLRNHLQNAWWNNSTWFLLASTLIRRSYLVTYVFIGATSMSRSGLSLKTGIYAWKSGIVGGFVSPIEFLITTFNQLSWCFCHSFKDSSVGLVVSWVARCALSSVWPCVSSWLSRLLLASLSFTCKDLSAVYRSSSLVTTVPCSASIAEFSWALSVVIKLVSALVADSVSWVEFMLLASGRCAGGLSCLVFSICFVCHLVSSASALFLFSGGFVRNPCSLALYLVPPVLVLHPWLRLAFCLLSVEFHHSLFFWRREVEFVLALSGSFACLGVELAL